MHYLFDVEDAEEYGLDEAVMLYNIRYWITLNKANNTNFYDGRTWTYNSITAFKELFPFWTENQIRRILKSLIDRHILITGNYNKRAYDRTLWYSFYDNSICENIEMDSYKSTIPIIENNEPIPDVNTNSKPVNKKIKSIKELSLTANESFNIFWDIYDLRKDKKKCMDVWGNIDEVIHKVINKHIIEYVKSTPDKSFRKNPLTYLKNECWNDEIVYRKSFKQTGTNWEEGGL